MFYTTYKWNVSSIQCKMGLRRSTSEGEVDPLSLILIYFNILTLTPGLHCAETALEFSDNKALLAVCRIDTRMVGKEGLDEHQVFGGIIYVYTCSTA
jgi:hypothetical protein